MTDEREHRNILANERNTDIPRREIRNNKKELFALGISYGFVGWNYYATVW